jgi:hypothetical protein
MTHLYDIYCKVRIAKFLPHFLERIFWKKNTLLTLFSIFDLEYSITKVQANPRCDKVIHSLKHDMYTIINTQLATWFGSSEPSSGQFLVYGHGAFRECAYYGIPYCLQTILIWKFKSKLHWQIYLLKYM